MARAIGIDHVDIYRMMVDVRTGHEQISTMAYGPYTSPRDAIDRTSRWCKDLPKRLRRQKLGITQTLRGECILAWQTTKAEYRNGGEDVDWDGV
jgi:hypothetical protein